MMTPRSVAMGNKVYKLHVKHGSNKECLTISPESTVNQLQDRIAKCFQIPPEEQVLVCNGKPIQLNGTMSLKQARIPNGSKILLQRYSESLAKPGQQPDGVGDVGIGGGILGEHSSEKQSTKVGIESPSSSCPLAALQSIENKGLEAENIVRQLGQEISGVKEQSTNKSVDDMKRLKRECGMQGEVVMKYLESLDQLRFGEEMVEARATRKRVANLLNRVLDINDDNIQSITSRLSNTQVN